MRSALRTFAPAAPVALALASILCALAPPTVATAQDSWSTPFPGVRRLYRRAAGPRRIHALAIDLCQPGVSLRATQSSERRQTPAAFGADVSAEAAINGDFFSYATYTAGGAARGAGNTWGNADGAGAGFLAFGGERIELSAPSAVVNPLPAWMSEVVGGHPLILRRGSVVSNGGELCTVRHPRTAAGFSRDRRTLYLMVVDGRSTSSIGMTCAEEATFLRELGAYDALNLDGGGSSSMWLRGTGVVNSPSDGSARVVANHLAVQANGSGLPGSCMPWEPEEVELFAPIADETGTTDLDGDGRADVCARAAAGIRCHLSTGDAFGAEIVGPELADDSGWGARRHWSTIAMGDVNGDGLADLCARAGAGMRCYPSTGTAFGPGIVGPELSNELGWDAPGHYATIRLADVDGDGLDDICARAATGFTCWRSNGTDFEAEGTPALAALSTASGWDAIERWGSLRMGDVDGDGLADVCGRGAEGVDCWRSNGSGFDATPIAGPRWTDASGWSAHRYGSTIRLTDVDGDRRADLCGRSADGFRCHLSSGGDFEPAIVTGVMADAGGWGEYSNYSTIRLADIDGDDDRDVCARANRGVVCWPFEDGVFGDIFDGPTLSDDSGWAAAAHYRTIRFGDVDGDGDDDLCARGSSRVYCWLAAGRTFGPRIDGPEWSNASGWALPQYHATMRFAGPRRAPPAPILPDAGPPSSDAGVPTSDASTGAPDAELGPGDAGERRDGTMTGGCACTAAGRSKSSKGAASIALITAALAARRRRRATTAGRRLVA